MKLKLLASVAAVGIFAAGAASAEPDGWYGAIDAGYHVMEDGINAESVRRMAQSGVLFVRRKTNAPKSPFAFCGPCCEHWRLRNQPCPEHVTAISRMIERPLADAVPA